MSRDLPVLGPAACPLSTLASDHPQGRPGEAELPESSCTVSREGKRGAQGLRAHLPWHPPPSLCWNLGTDPGVVLTACPHRRAQDPVQHLVAQRAAPALPQLLPTVLRGPGLPQQLRVPPLRQPGQQPGTFPSAGPRACPRREPPQPRPQPPPVQPPEALCLLPPCAKPGHRPLPGCAERAAGPPGQHRGGFSEPRE